MPIERILHHSCRAVIGVTGRLHHHAIVRDVLPA
jgi:hypothetical protein